MDLDEFLAEEEKRIQDFRDWYKKQHTINPEHYPLSLPIDNAGAWNEMLQEFDTDDPIYQ